MRFGIVLPHFRQAASTAAIRDCAQTAEQLGFDSIWVTDRAAIPQRSSVKDRFGPDFYDPFVTLGYVAAITSRVRIGATVFVLPFRHPVLTARALASLDQFSSGRLIAGIGTGWMPREFEAIGVSFTRRGRLTDEYLEAILALWSAPVASFHGPTVSFDDLISQPRPVQQPHPPIWVGGGSPAALARSVRYGNAWHGWPAPLAELQATASALHVEAQRQGRDPASIALTTRAPLRFLTRSNQSVSSEAAPEEPIGTPDQVTAALYRYAAAGFSEVVFDTFYGHPRLDNATPAGIQQTLTDFARTVMPALRQR